LQLPRPGRFDPPLVINFFGHDPTRKLLIV